MDLLESSDSELNTSGMTQMTSGLAYERHRCRVLPLSKQEDGVHCSLRGRTLHWWHSCASPKMQSYLNKGKAGRSSANMTVEPNILMGSMFHKALKENQKASLVHLMYKGYR